jgi:SAM-dependent methyltransferase
MIKVAKKNYPKGDFKQGDMMNSLLFQPQTFTHITCFYFTLYYTNNKPLFFENCYSWLKPGGHLIVHLVDGEMFDPMLNNPLLYISPQRYAKERMTSSKIIFNNFEYKSNFEYLPEKKKAIFHEKFYNKDKVRKNEHELFMEPIDEIQEMALQQGFILQGIVDLIKVSYEYQYLYIFVKPN